MHPFYEILDSKSGNFEMSDDIRFVEASTSNGIK